MLLTLDIGNTEITLGLFAGGNLEDHWRMTTNPDRTPDEWGSAVGAFLIHAGHSPNEVRATCLASLAPAVTQSVIEGIARITGTTAVSVDAQSGLPIVLDVDEPLSVGADRIVNSLAAVELYHEDTIVVDFGTGNFCAGGGGAKQRDGIGVFHLSKFEVTRPVGFFTGPMGEGRLGQREQIRGAQSESPGQPVKRIELRRLLVALELRDNSNRHA